LEINCDEKLWQYPVPEWRMVYTRLILTRQKEPKQAFFEYRIRGR